MYFIFNILTQYWNIKDITDKDFKDPHFNKHQYSHLIYMENNHRKIKISKIFCAECVKHCLKTFSLLHDQHLCTSVTRSYSVSLLSLSEYAPSRLRDDEPFCVFADLDTSADDDFESGKQNTKPSNYNDPLYMQK